MPPAGLPRYGLRGSNRRTRAVVRPVTKLLPGVYSVTTRRRPLAGDTSTASATMSPTTGQRVQWPPNQWYTTEYQSNVVGRKTKPRMSHSGRPTTPLNQVVKNHRRKTTSRGAMSARRAKRQGMEGNVRVSRGRGWFDRLATGVGARAAGVGAPTGALGRVLLGTGNAEGGGGLGRCSGQKNAVRSERPRPPPPSAPPRSQKIATG